MLAAESDVDAADIQVDLPLHLRVRPLTQGAVRAKITRPYCLQATCISDALVDPLSSMKWSCLIYERIAQFKMTCSSAIQTLSSRVRKSYVCLGVAIPDLKFGGSPHEAVSMLALTCSSVEDKTSQCKSPIQIRKVDSRLPSMACKEDIAQLVTYRKMSAKLMTSPAYVFQCVEPA